MVTMKWTVGQLVLACVAFQLCVAAKPKDIPCQWTSYTGASFDMRPLTLVSGSKNKQCYGINDGDIPCTPEHERVYSFAWNFCGDITPECFPNNPKCKAESGAAIQYLHRESDGYEECNVLGHYDPNRDDTYYSLLDENDPSKGVQMKYLYGDRCPSGSLRTATLELHCANTKFEIDSALEPRNCDYHMTMRSYYGCPLECPVSSHGLCNSHGHCKYDPAIKAPRCYCNQGYDGAGCTTHSSSSSSSSSIDSLSVQLGLMSTLLIIALALIGVMGYMAHRIKAFRTEQTYSTHGSMELTDQY